MRVVMLGPPGAGKGTQAQILQQRYGASHISTGDVLRKHRSEKTPLGEQAQAYMDRGELVPDGLIIAMVKDELAGRSSFILDGFPRTVAQAEALDVLLTELALPLDAVICLEAERSVLLRRLTARWTNPRTGRVYNELSCPPKTHAVDDEDGGPLVQRTDDQAETVQHRLDVYEQQTAPLAAYYEQKNILVRINGLLPVEEVTQAILAQTVLTKTGRA